MPPEQESVSQEAVSRRFEKLSARLRPSITPEQWLVREHVAVRIDFSLNDLQPALKAGGSSATMQEAIRAVLAESYVIYSDDGLPLWRLRHGVRREALQRLAAEDRLIEFLAANPATHQSLLQETFDATVRGEVPPIEEQSLPRLEAMLQVISWLDGFISDLPDKKQLRERIAYERLVEPFRSLAGEHFSGRKEELALLNDFVSITDEAPFEEKHKNLLDRARRYTAGEALNDSRVEPKPLHIYGMGGIGKSTLISRLILDQEVKTDQKTPFVYIDFNRRDIELENPVSILLETTRQLAIQYPGDEVRWHELGDQYRFSMQELAHDTEQYAFESVASFRIREWKRYVHEFIAVLKRLQSPEKPFLLVLDTLEELLFHDVEYLAGLWEFLELLQENLPGMRRILSGRTPLPADYPVYNLLLDGLDEESAINVLLKRGVPDKEVAGHIVARFGRIPLTLWLAAELYDRLPEEEKSFETFETANSYFYQVKEYLIQGVLYRRFLGYLHDDDDRLKKLAHPGLVLRRITPDLILNVLAKAYDIEVNNLDEARDLFNRLRQEVSIVEIDSAETGELRHRPELRLAMLDLLMQDEPEQVKTIHRLAADYFAARPDPDIRDRADYLYHRLAIREDKELDPAILDDYSPSELQQIADELGSAIEDLPPQAQLLLLGRVKSTIQLDEKVLETADLKTWEFKTARSVKVLLNRRHYQKTLDRLAVRKDRSPESPLWQPQIAALLGLKRSPEALEVITRGIQLAPPYSATMQMLFVEQAAIFEARSDYVEALQSYRQALKIAEQRQDKIELLRIQLDIMRLSRNVYHQDHEGHRPQEESALLEKAWNVLDDQELAGHTTLVRDVAGLMAAQNPEIVVRALRLVGLQGARPDNVEHLARSLAAWDDLRSGEMDEEPGMLARKVGARWDSDLYTTWLSFLEQTEWDKGSFALQTLFDEVPLTSTLAITLVELIKARLLLTTEEAHLLQETLETAFTPDELSTILQGEFDSSLSRITGATEYERQIADVISWAESTGRLATLLRALRAARPQQPQLLTLLERLGIDTDLTAAAVDPEAAIYLLEQALQQAQKNGDLAQEFEARLRLGSVYLDREQENKDADNALALEAFLAAQAILDPTIDPQMIVLMFCGLGSAYQRQNRITEAVDEHKRALQIRQQIGDRTGEVDSLATLGNILYASGSYQAAQDYIEQALNSARSIENKIEVGNQLGNLGLVYHKLGNIEEAIEFYQEAIEVRHEIGDRHGEAADLGNLGNAYLDLDQLEEAVDFHQKALDISRSLGERGGEVTDLTNLGAVYAAQGFFDMAYETFQEARAIDKEFLGSESLKTATIFNALGKLQRMRGNYKEAQSYLERAIAIKEAILGSDHPDVASVLNNLGSLLQDMGAYAAAQPLLDRALAIREAKLGLEHPDTAASLNNLGGLLQIQGSYQKARSYYERALAIQEKTRGSQHPDTAQSLNNLGLLLDSQGYYQEAQPYFERALAIREKALGPDHPDTAQSLNNLGLLLQAQGDYAAARPYFERALDIREKVLGPDHPDTAASLNSLSFLLQAQGDYAAARLHYERALDIRERALGPDHPDTAASLNNLGGLLQAQGDYAAARPYFERALELNEKALGPDHPQTAVSLNNLGLLLQAQGDYAAARPLYERALVVQEKVLSPDHPDTAASLNNLGFLLQAQGDYAAARPLYERALAIREKALGPDHPDTAASLNNLGLLLQTQGDYEEARPYFERALAVQEKVLVAQHPDTAASLNNLGLLLDSQGNYQEARLYFERALAIREKALGPDHPDTAASLNNLGNLLRALGDYEEAQPYYERALALNEKALGPWHPDTALSLNNLGGLLQAQGDYAAAQPYFERALDILERSLGPDHPKTITVRDNLSKQARKQGDETGIGETVIFNQQGQTASGAQTNIGTTGGNISHIGGDFVMGDKVSGDKVGGDAISVGDISGSSGIAIGRGASARTIVGGAEEEFQQKENAIGRLELLQKTSRFTATAFLVAPDLIMTSYHAVVSLIDQELPPEKATIRFDLLETAAKSVVSQGQAYALAVGKEAQKRYDSKWSWLVAYDKTLDFAILRLASPAGEDVAGGLRKGRKRGWLTLSSALDIDEGDRLRILGLDSFGRIKSEILKGADITLSDDGRRLRYHLSRRFGTSGAPLLDIDGNVVGMHLKFSSAADASEAVAMPPVNEHLRQMGIQF